MKTLSCAILGMLFAVCASAADSGALSLKLTVLNAAINDHVEVRVTTTNESDHPITYYNTNRCNYSFKILAPTGMTVPETNERKRLNCDNQSGIEITGRRIAITLKPGESSSDDLRLLDFNDIPQEGVYSVQVERKFPGIGDVISNAIEVGVKP